MLIQPLISRDQLFGPNANLRLRVVASRKAAVIVS
jgi:hypothetical protein